MFVVGLMFQVLNLMYINLCRLPVSKYTVFDDIKVEPETLEDVDI